jgi:uncharacterized protein DUF4118
MDKPLPMMDGLTDRQPVSATHLVTVALAGLAPLAVACALVPLRGRLHTSVIALVLVLAVVASGAGGGRAAGAAAAAVSALSFDFFHTRPYLSLTIASAEDVETTVLLLLIGIAVGQLAILARRRRSEAAEGRSELASLFRVAEQATQDIDPEVLIAAVRNELTEVLSLDQCTYQPGPPPEGSHTLEPSGWIDAGGVHRYSRGGFALPPEGVSIQVRGRGMVLGHLFCLPSRGTAVSLERRRVAVALADQLGVALGASATTPPAISPGDRAPR